MKRLRKSNRVSWASGFNLSQVKLFLSEESPSKVGMGLENHRHANPPSALHSNNTKSNDMPPGFENNHGMNMKEQLYHIPLAKWRCPPKFIMSSNWQIAAGEESEEVIVQKLREMRVMEAVYPHYSAIPSCPTVSVGTQHEGYDSDLTPVIPIIPIEEEEASDISVHSSISDTTHVSSLLHVLPKAPVLASGAEDTSETTSPASDPHPKERPALGMSCGLGSDVITAAAALAAGIKSNVIDTQLLVKILRDQKMIEKLTMDCGVAANSGTMTEGNAVSEPLSGLQQASQAISLVSAPTSALKPATKPNHLANPKPGMVQPLRSVTGKLGQLATGMEPVFTTAPAQLATRSASFGPRPVNQLVTRPGPEHNTGPLPGLGNANTHKTQNQVNLMPNVMSVNGMVPNPPLPTVKPSDVKDDNYYKNLIRQHGGDSRGSGLQIHYGNLPDNQNHNLEMMQKLNKGKPKLMNQKPCVHFNTAKGCRFGAKCVFKHEGTSLQKRVGGIMMEVPDGKRMKLGGEIMGRT